VIEYESIVVGSSFKAVLYAFNNNFPLFFAECRRPFRFDYLGPNRDLSCLQIPDYGKSLTTFGEEKKIGVTKEDVWERMLFLLGLDGKLPLSNLCHTLRFDGDRVACANEYSRILEFKFSECFYFGDRQSTGFAQEKALDEKRYVCYDYIAFNKGGKHEVDHIHTGDDFVGEIWFYPSDRIDGNTPVRDACAISTLTTQQIKDFNFSETMARFKTIHEMEKRGMKGAFAGAYTSAGNPKHYKFRTTSIYRQTDQPEYEYESHTPTVKIPQVCEEDLLGALSQSCVAYNRFLR